MSAPDGMPLYFIPGTDDPELYASAQKAAYAVMAGRLDTDTARRTIRVLAGLNKRFVQMRLMWWMTDCMSWRAQQMEQERHHAEQAEWDIRLAVRPLFPAHASKAQLEEAAGSANRNRLSWNTVFSILTDELKRSRQYRRAA